jgi:hypothetical protein
MEQLKDNLGASGWRLGDEQVRRLNDVSELPSLYPYRFIEEMARKR